MFLNFMRISGKYFFLKVSPAQSDIWEILNDLILVFVSIKERHEKILVRMLFTVSIKVWISNILKEFIYELIE